MKPRRFQEAKMKPKSPLEEKKIIREAIPQNVILRPFFFLGGPPRFPAGRPVKKLVREGAFGLHFRFLEPSGLHFGVLGKATARLTRVTLRSSGDVRKVNTCNLAVVRGCSLG